jgi:hypothetical protein
LGVSHHQNLLVNVVGVAPLTQQYDLGMAVAFDCHGFGIVVPSAKNASSDAVSPETDEHVVALDNLECHLDQSDHALLSRALAKEVVFEHYVATVRASRMPKRYAWQLGKSPMKVRLPLAP